MKYTPSLDGLRALAVGIVLMAHAGVPHIRSGAAGVDIFFTLSGFLITSILLAELDRTRTIRLHHFYIRRFLRLLPCLWLTLGMVSVVWGITGHFHEVLLDLVCAGTYSMNWFRSEGLCGRGPLSHTWTLAIEEQYYLLWPLVVTLFLRDRDRRVVQSCCLLVLAIAIVAYRVAVANIFSLDRIHYGLDTHADPLLLGSALACLLSARPGLILPAMASRVLGLVLSPLSLVAIGAIVTMWAWGEGPPASTFGYPLVGLATAIVLLDCIAGNHCMIRWALETRALVWVGRVSYGVYLWHLPIFLMMRSSGFDGWRSLVVLGIPLTLIVSAISFYGFERYCLLLKERFASKEPRGTIAPPRFAFLNPPRLTWRS